MNGQELKLAILNLKAFHQFATEMKTGGRRYNGALFRGINRLIAVCIIRIDIACDILGNRCITHTKQ